MTLNRPTLEDFYSDKNVLVTGGKGFIGSHIAEELIKLGAQVVIIDSDRECSGANDYNINTINESVRIINGDIVNKEDVKKAVVNKDLIFHTAAQVSRVKAQSNPIEDTEINCEGTLNILEAAKDIPKSPKIVFTSSRAVYGSPDKIPVPESVHPDPMDIYGANKAAAEFYCNVYDKTSDLSCTIARLTNVYGPRAQIDNPNYGVLNLFVRYAIQDEELTVYEPGTMKRDVIYVKDVVYGLLSLGEHPDTGGEIFNIGSSEVFSIEEIALKIVGIAGSGRVVSTDWPSEWEKMKIGDFASDNSKISEVTGWSPSYTFDRGIRNTIEFYKENLDKYSKTV